MQWEKHYQQLIKFKEEHGHLSIPTKYKENLKLSMWMSNQRVNYHKGTMTPERKKRLDELGFIWRKRERTPKTYYFWDMMYQEIQEFEKKYGHLAVPYSFIWKEDMPLGLWAANQRSRYNRGELTELQIQRLNDIDFIWDVGKWSWEQRYEELVRYSLKHGNCHVWYTEIGQVWENCPMLNTTFGEWVRKQRLMYSKGELTEYQIKKLEDLGFDWEYDNREKQWDCMLDELVKYGEKLGTVNFSKFRPEHPHYDISSWANNQRMRYRKGKLSKRRIQKLENIGFVWDLATTYKGRKRYQATKLWLASLEELKDYLTDGEIDMPSLRKNNQSLYTWATKQLRAYRKGAMEGFKIQLFEEAGFDLAVNQLAYSAWRASFDEVVDCMRFARENQICLKSYDLKSYEWIRRQYRRFKDGELKEWQSDLIKEIEFDIICTRKINSSWLETCEKLRSYRVAGMSTDDIKEENANMYYWLRREMKKYTLGRLSEQKIMLLKQSSAEFESFLNSEQNKLA